MKKSVYIKGKVVGEPVFSSNRCRFAISTDNGIYIMTAEEFADLGMVVNGKNLEIMGNYNEETPKQINVDTIFFT